MFSNILLKTIRIHAAPVLDTRYILLDTSYFTNWENDEVGIGVYLNNTTGKKKKKTVLMDKIDDHLFRTEITGLKTKSESVRSRFRKRSKSQVQMTVLLLKTIPNLISDCSLKRFSVLTIKTNGSSVTNPASFTAVVSGFSDSETSKSVVISGIPYGTSYTVTENDNPLPDNWALSGSTSTSGTITNNTTATFTNKIVFTDEMNPAYLMLYEHINEKIDAWCDPTFIFKITQTKDASGTSLTAQRTHIVALTVNDDNNTGKFVSSLSSYNTWLQESTDELEYHGMYHIDSQGRIRVEPGSYEITRVSVSRYEFVTSASTNQYLSGDTITQTETTDDTEHDNRKKVIITGLAAGKTIDVHYYDQVAYYDKFTHVDTAVNKFYTLDNSNQNTTVKGIRVKDITNVDTDAAVTIDQSNADLKLYFIYVDGTEREITDRAEKAKLSFTYEGSDTTFTTKFTTTESSFTITADSGFKDKIYTLKATYDGRFSTNFDLVFERTP